MTISIDNQPKLFLNYKVEEYVEYRLTFTSRWNRKQIQEDGIVYDFILERPDIANDRYTEWTLTPALILEKFDLEGWYNYRLEGSNDGIDWSQIEMGTVKLKNSSERQLDQKSKYEGPNPDAQNYIIY